jgi:hypothetical protein
LEPTVCHSVAGCVLTLAVLLPGGGVCIG